jgi:hypothetical protein
MSTVSRAFADTMPMYGSTRSSGKGAAFAMFTCRCETPTLYRVQRAFWMRFVPAMRLYVCRNCGTRVLRRRMPAEPSHRTLGYLPPYYLPRSTRGKVAPRVSPVVLQLVLSDDMLRYTTARTTTTESSH